MNKLPMAVLTASVALMPARAGEPAPAVSAAAHSSNAFFLYIGTYTGLKSKGIHLSRFDASSGTLGAPTLAAEATHPTFLTVHPGSPRPATAQRPILYAVNETGWGGKSGTVSAYGIERPGGRLVPLNRQSSGGGGPCHLSVDASGQCVLVANYGGGSIAALPVRADGSLGEATAFIQHAGSGASPKRQEAPHAHFIQPDPDNRFALVCDLGLDQVLCYRLKAGRGAMQAHDPPFARLPAGAGPRHLAFHPQGAVAYVINELNSTLTALRWDAQRGILDPFQTLSTLPPGCTNQNSTAEVQVHPSGRFLYGSNRGHDSIVVCALEARTGRMTPVQHQSILGKTPRHFALDPSGQWLLAANQGSDNVVVFRVDARTGTLTPAGQSIEVGAPVCLQLVPLN